jgi:hypothetical protein
MSHTFVPSLAAVQAVGKAAGARCVTTRTSRKSHSGVVAHVVFSTHALAARFARRYAWPLARRSCVVRRIARQASPAAFYVSVPVQV